MTYAFFLEKSLTLFSYPLTFQVFWSLPSILWPWPDATIVCGHRSKKRQATKGHFALQRRRCVCARGAQEGTTPWEPHTAERVEARPVFSFLPSGAGWAFLAAPPDASSSFVVVSSFQTSDHFSATILTSLTCRHVATSQAVTKKTEKRFV